MQNKKFASIDHRHLTIDTTFRHRKVTENAVHVVTLRKTLRNTGKLDPVLVWREQGEDGKATGRLVLLDGHFRVEAYRAEITEGRIEGRGIPALIGQGSRIDAELAALSANVRDALPLTPSERTDAAWALVRRHRKAISRSQLSKASGVSERTISYMRKKLKEFIEAGAEPEGSWWRDRSWPAETDFTPPSDEERERNIAALAEAFTNALREHRIRDVETKAEALMRALGQRELEAVVEYLGIVDNEVDEFAIDLTPEELSDDTIASF